MTELEIIKEEMKKLQSRIEELEKHQENPTAWTPKDGEGIYILYPDGEITFAKYFDGVKITTKRLNQGNIFPTKEAAEWEREHRKVLHEMKRYTKEFVHGEVNYDICYDHDEERVLIDAWFSNQHTLFFFESEEKAQACIDAIGEERLKKYYLNLK